MSLAYKTLKALSYGVCVCVCACVRACMCACVELERRHDADVFT